MSLSSSSSSSSSSLVLSLALALAVLLMFVLTWRFQLLTSVSFDSSPTLKPFDPTRYTNYIGGSSTFTVNYNGSSSNSSLSINDDNYSNGSSSFTPNYNGSSSNSSLSISAPQDVNFDLSTPNKSSIATNPNNTDEAIQWSSSKLQRVEASLAKARHFIRNATSVRNLMSVHQDPDYVPQGPIYRNPNAFHRSYMEMEKRFKIYVYEEGEPPMFHTGPLKNIYSSEGRFIHELAKTDQFYRTEDPEEAAVYFLPFSVVMMVHHLYEPRLKDVEPVGRTVADYVRVIANKHRFWNRSLGADHFMLSCHDWGPRTSAYVPELFHNSIRVLCNANTSEGFKPSKDASFPEINLLTGEIRGLLGGLPPSKRSTLAFFAGRLHGHIRYLLLEQWKNKDQDIRVYNELPVGLSYTQMLKQSKFCLCPSGYEVASPRVVEAIYSECIPVLISDGYIPPFNDVLNWKAFSVQIRVKDIPNIKNILMGISQGHYLRMLRRVRQVQRHFVVNNPPKRFDVFHMTLHSVWLRRLNIQIKD